MSAARRIRPADLIGWKVTQAERADDGALTLVLSGLHLSGRNLDLTCSVMRDPEGNGPGSLHVYDSLGDFRGIL